MAAILAEFGESWDSDENLHEVCKKLDDTGVPPSAEWKTLNPPARSWRVACREYRERTIKAINYRRDHAPAKES